MGQNWIAAGQVLAAVRLLAVGLGAYIYLTRPPATVMSQFADLQRAVE